MNKQEIRCELQQISRERGGNGRWQERWMMGGGKETGRMRGRGRRGRQNNSYVSWVRKKWDDTNSCVVIFKAFCVFFPPVRVVFCFFSFLGRFSNARHFAEAINASGIWIERKAERQKEPESNQHEIKCELRQTPTESVIRSGCQDWYKRRASC